jgi:hypothetical protein
MVYVLILMSDVIRIVAFSRLNAQMADALITCLTADLILMHHPPM